VIFPAALVGTLWKSRKTDLEVRVTGFWFCPQKINGVRSVEIEYEVYADEIKDMFPPDRRFNYDRLLFLFERIN
jgi:hypothetical protein